MRGTEGEAALTVCLLDPVLADLLPLDRCEDHFSALNGFTISPLYEVRVGLVLTSPKCRSMYRALFSGVFRFRAERVNGKWVQVFLRPPPPPLFGGVVYVKFFFLMQAHTSYAVLASKWYKHAPVLMDEVVARESVCSSNVTTWTLVCHSYGAPGGAYISIYRLYHLSKYMPPL